MPPPCSTRWNYFTKGIHPNPVSYDTVCTRIVELASLLVMLLVLCAIKKKMNALLNANVIIDSFHRFFGSFVRWTENQKASPFS